MEELNDCIDILNAFKNLEIIDGSDLLLNNSDHALLYKAYKNANDLDEGEQELLDRMEKAINNRKNLDIEKIEKQKNDLVDKAIDYIRSYYRMHVLPDGIGVDEDAPKYLKTIGTHDKFIKKISKPIDPLKEVWEYNTEEYLYVQLYVLLDDLTKYINTIEYDEVKIKETYLSHIKSLKETILMINRIPNKGEYFFKDGIDQRVFYDELIYLFEHYTWGKQDNTGIYQEDYYTLFGIEEIIWYVNFVNFKKHYLEHHDMSIDSHTELGKWLENLKNERYFDGDKPEHLAEHDKLLNILCPEFELESKNHIRPKTLSK